MIRLLGTGAADGWPNPFCTCASCESARAAGVIRAQTSAIVDQFVLDFGPDTMRAAERCGASLRDIRHVLLTHNHPDHTAPAFLLYRSWVSDQPLDVVGPPSVIENARMWLAPDTHVVFHEVRPGDELRLAGGTVRVLEALHDQDAVLYDVSSASGRLLYATDTGPLPDSTIASVRDAAYDVVLLEETFGAFTTHGKAHLDFEAFAQQVRRLRAAGAIVERTDLVAVHLSHHNPPLPQLEQRLAAYGARVVPDGTVLMPDTKPTVGPARRTLVIGGARSGKSTAAESLLLAEQDVTYVATSYPRSNDPEWEERLRRHREQRPSEWSTVETIELVDLLRTPGGPLLIDCLTLWLTRVMDRHDAWSDQTWIDTAAAAVRAEVQALVDAWRGTARRVVAVTNEVGQGVVPAEASTRRFRDEMGRLNSALAAQTEDVRLCVAGRVITL